MKYLISLSGGMDSTTLLYEYQHAIGLAVSFNYGSNHNDREIEYAKRSCERLRLPHKIIHVEEVFKSFDSALLSGAQDIPEGHYADENMKKTVVPFRNGIMDAILAGYADSHDLGGILVASHFGDDAVYPDCRTGFNEAMTKAIKEGTYNKVQLKAPYALITKEDIARKGDHLGVPWSATYSCYKGGEAHCGRCSTCVERIWALRFSNDTTKYMDKEYAKKLLKAKGEW